MHFLVYIFFFNDTATTEIYTLSLHDALPISAVRVGRRRRLAGRAPAPAPDVVRRYGPRVRPGRDRKSTRLNSSHSQISYAVFCLKKKKTKPFASARTSYSQVARFLLTNRPTM